MIDWMLLHRQLIAVILGCIGILCVSFVFWWQRETEKLEQKWEDWQKAWEQAERDGLL